MPNFNDRFFQLMELIDNSIEKLNNLSDQSNESRSELITEIESDINSYLDKKNIDQKPESFIKGDSSVS